MNAVVGEKPPAWFWVVSALLFAWMCIGVIGFAMTDAEAIAMLPAPQQQLYALMPKWLWVIYGIATIRRLIGCGVSAGHHHARRHRRLVLDDGEGTRLAFLIDPPMQRR